SPAGPPPRWIRPPRAARPRASAHGPAPAPPAAQRKRRLPVDTSAPVARPRAPHVVLPRAAHVARPSTGRPRAARPAVAARRDGRQLAVLAVDSAAVLALLAGAVGLALRARGRTRDVHIIAGRDDG